MWPSWSAAKYGLMLSEGAPVAFPLGTIRVQVGLPLKKSRAFFDSKIFFLFAAAFDFTFIQVSSPFF